MSGVAHFRPKRKGMKWLFSVINFGAFMQRRSPRTNEKGECEKNMDGLSYFKHVVIVALDFPTNPEAKESADIRGAVRGGY